MRNVWFRRISPWPAQSDILRLSQKLDTLMNRNAMRSISASLWIYLIKTISLSFLCYGLCRCFLFPPCSHCLLGSRPYIIQFIKVCRWPNGFQVSWPSLLANSLLVAETHTTIHRNSQVVEVSLTSVVSLRGRDILISRRSAWLLLGCPLALSLVLSVGRSSLSMFLLHPRCFAVTLRIRVGCELASPHS